MPRDDDEPRPKKRPRDDDDEIPRAKKRPAADADDEPRPKKRRVVDDEDEKPRVKKRPRDEVDDYDDAPPRKRKKSSSKDDGGLGTLVPYRNGPALAAYYCGVFSFIPVLCFLLGPIAFILGLIGVFKAKKNPKARGMGHAIAGIICGIVAPPLWVLLWYTVFEKLTQPNAG
jgi:hypothetical protein